MKLYNSKTKELVSFVQAVKDGLGKERITLRQKN